MKKINLLNKTISPLSDGKGCPVERGGVWELPRRTPCATPSWKEGEHKVPSFRGNAESPRCCRELVCGKTDGIPLFSGMTKKICHKFPSREGWRVAPAGVWFAALVALFIATPSFAEPTELDKKTVASKAYVDTKQDIIETGNVMFHDDPEGTEGDMYVPGLVAYDPQTSALSGNKIGILDYETILGDEGDLSLYSNFGGGYGSEMDNFVPTVRAVAEALQIVLDNMPYWTPLTWNNTQSVAINAYNTTFGTGTNQWAGTGTDLINGQFLANSLALKQNRITTGLVEFNDNPEFMLPAITTYDSTSGLVGNKIGILDAQTISDDEGDLSVYGGSAYGSEMDNYVPTVRAVAEGLAAKQNKLPEAWTSTTIYYLMASTGGQTIDLGANSGVVGRRYITAGGSQPLTQKSGADNVILYINGTKTLAQYETSNFGGTSGNATTSLNYVKGALVSLELLKDVYSALHNEIQNATPTGTPGNVAMYDATTGELGDGVATYDGSTTYNASTDADKIAVMSGVQRKKECGGYEPGHENDPDYCWLWILPD